MPKFGTRFQLLTDIVHGLDNLSSGIHRHCTTWGGGGVISSCFGCNLSGEINC